MMRVWIGLVGVARADFGTVCPLHDLLDLYCHKSLLDIIAYSVVSGLFIRCEESSEPILRSGCVALVLVPTIRCWWPSLRPYICYHAMNAIAVLQ